MTERLTIVLLMLIGGLEAGGMCLADYQRFIRCFHLTCCRDFILHESLCKPICGNVFCTNNAKCISGKCECQNQESCSIPMEEACKPNNNQLCLDDCVKHGKCICKSSCYQPINNKCYLKNTCTVNGVCYRNGDTDGSCKVCKPELSQTSLQNIAAETSCDDRYFCTESDKCDGQGNCKGRLLLACTTTTTKKPTVTCNPDCNRGAECILGKCDCAPTGYYGDDCSQSLASYCAPSNEKPCVKACVSRDSNNQCVCESPCYESTGSRCQLVLTCVTSDGKCYREGERDGGGCKVCLSKQSKSQLFNRETSRFSRCNDASKCIGDGVCDGKGRCFGVTSQEACAFNRKMEVGSACSPVGYRITHEYNITVHYWCTNQGIVLATNPLGTYWNGEAFVNIFSLPETILKHYADLVSSLTT